MINCAVTVAFLADLGHAKLHGPGIQSGSHRQRPEIDSVYDQIFTKGTVAHVCSALIKLLYLIIGKKTHLPVPRSRVGIALNSEIRNKMAFRDGMLFRSPGRTDADSLHYACFIKIHVSHPPIALMPCASVI